MRAPFQTKKICIPKWENDKHFLPSTGRNSTLPGTLVFLGTEPLQTPFVPKVIWWPLASKCSLPNLPTFDIGTFW